MLGLGVLISRELQLIITVLTIVIMVGGLTPKFWRRHQAKHAHRALPNEESQERLTVLDDLLK